MFSTSDSAFDDQLIDMNFWLGDPFPLVLPSGKAVESVASLDNDLLRVDVKNHEGNKDADLPFTVEPKQMVQPDRKASSILFICSLLTRRLPLEAKPLSKLVLARDWSPTRRLFRPASTHFRWLIVTLTKRCVHVMYRHAWRSDPI